MTPPRLLLIFGLAVCSLAQTRQQNPITNNLTYTSQCGGPDWIDRERYDISARADRITGPLPIEELRPRLLSLIYDRSDRKAHSETLRMPIYALLVDKARQKLKPSEPVNRRYEVALAGFPQASIESRILRNTLARET